MLGGNLIDIILLAILLIASILFLNFLLTLVHELAHKLVGLWYGVPMEIELNVLSVLGKGYSEFSSSGKKFGELGKTSQSRILLAGMSADLISMFLLFYLILSTEQYFWKFVFLGSLLIRLLSTIKNFREGDFQDYHKITS